jgi:peptidoglycan/LPS O-acetylase OafA/YrhL
MIPQERTLSLLSARRLLPAHFVVVMACLLAAILVTTPNDYAQISDQARFATFFASSGSGWAAPISTMLSSNHCCIFGRMA